MKRTLLALLGVAAIAGCTTQTFDERLERIRADRRALNQEAVRLGREHARTSEPTHQETALEQAIQAQHNLAIIGLPEHKTEKRLNQLNERFTRYRQLYGPNTACKEIFLLDVIDDMNFWRDRAGSMSSHGYMTLYSTLASNRLLDHEYTHARQYQHPEETKRRHDQLIRIIEQSGDQFKNDHYDPDTPSTWKDGSHHPRGYMITAYSNIDPYEFGAEWNEETAAFLRNDPSNITNLDYTLPHWENVFSLLSGIDLPKPWADFLILYVRDSKFRDTVDIAHSWNMDLEEPRELDFLRTHYANQETKPLYAAFDKDKRFTNATLRAKAFANPQATLLAKKAIIEHPMIGGVLDVRNQRLPHYTAPSNHGFPYVLDECIKNYDRVERILSSYLRSTERVSDTNR